MIKYFAYYPHEFHNDPRVTQLTTKEQQQFLFLLSKMSQAGASITENYKELGRLLDINTAGTQRFIVRLKNLGLLVASETGEKLFTLTSTRLTKEYIKAKTGCDAASKKAKDAADARWGNPRGIESG